MQIEAFADDAAQQFFHVDHELVQVDHARLEQLFPAEGEQLLGHAGRLLACFAGLTRRAA